MADKSLFAGLDRKKHGKLEEFLTSIKSLDINGKQIIQTQDGEFIEHILMEESYFVDNWLVQFAIGHVGSKNYFDQESWNRITDGYTKGVIVLNEEKEPVLIIRKFIDMDLNANADAYLQYYTRQAAHVANIPDKHQVDQIVGSLAEIIDKLTEQNPEYDTLTAMIPYEYYLSKGVDPMVLKQVIYIRDTYQYQGKPISGNEELIKQIEGILYKNARQEKITPAEIKLINEITNGEFIFNDSPNIVEDNISQKEQKDFDPLAD